MVRTLTILLALWAATSTFACGPLVQNYAFECKLEDNYQTVKRNLKSGFNVDGEYTVANRALRLIDQDEYDETRNQTNFMPWKVYDPAPETWMLWEKGAWMVEEMVKDQSLTKLTIDDLESLNQALISKKMMTFLSRIKGNSPGKIRSAKVIAPPGMEFKCSENPMSDDDYQMLQNYDLNDYEGEPLMRLKFFKKCQGKGYGGQIWYMPGNKVKTELQRLLDHFNVNFAKFVNGEQTDKSPVEFIVDFQRWFIAIHPFGDGNGRTSRFIQDMFMKKLGLPFIPTGRISMLATREEIIKRTKKELSRSVQYLEGCLGGYQKRKADSRTVISGHCLPIYDDIDTGEAPSSKAERIEFGRGIRR